MCACVCVGRWMVGATFTVAHLHVQATNPTLLRHRRNLGLPLPTSAVLTGKKLRAQLLTADEDIPPPITGAAPPSFQVLLTGLNQRGLCEEGGSTGLCIVIVAQ